MEKPEANKKFDEEFGLFVKKMRLKKGWSQEDLASKVGNNFQNISRLERGKITPTLFWCYRLADAFEVTLPALLKNFKTSTH